MQEKWRELMLCEKCGNELKEGAEFCCKCGCPVKSHKRSVATESISGISKGKMKKKTLFITGGELLLLAVTGGLVTWALIHNSDASRLDRQIALAEKYVSELDYEHAVIAYEEAITIDPKNENLYLALAEVYEEVGEYGKAQEVLERGIAETNSELLVTQMTVLKEMLAFPYDEELMLSETEIELETSTEDFVIVWEDVGVEACVRDTLNKPTGDIYWSEVQEITSLDGNGFDYNYDIECINDLRYLVNLQWLDLWDNNISDISALSGLKSLQGVWLNDNNISDISTLRGLTNLRNLGLGNNNISDISPLSNLTNLQTLDLYNNNISDIGVLSSLTNLQTLDFGYNNINDISTLSNLTNLQELYLYNNNISDISVLSGLTNLQRLCLAENVISDISALSRLKKLYWLELDDNNISDISVLSGLTNLQYLYLDGNNISDYSPVSFVPDLSY